MSKAEITTIQEELKNLSADFVEFNKRFTTHVHQNPVVDNQWFQETFKVLEKRIRTLEDQEQEKREYGTNLKEVLPPELDNMLRELNDARYHMGEVASTIRNLTSKIKNLQLKKLLQHAKALQEQLGRPEPDVQISEIDEEDEGYDA